MGKIELDHTGSGGGITLSSDGTSLLLGGTAVGGGADLYAANEVSVTSQPSATGDDAVAIGDSATASAENSIAIGHTASTSGVYSVALGRNTSSTSASAAAIGFNATASGTQSVALGNTSIASGTNALAGPNSTASGTNSFALGQSASASNFGGAAFGKGATTAVNNYNVAIGNSYTSGADAFAAAIANNTSSYGATATSSVAIGYQAKATNQAVSIGTQTTASGLYGTAMGYLATASGLYSVSLGRNATASGTHSTVLGGYASTANADHSHVIGGFLSSTDSKQYATVIGPYAKAKAENSFTFGSKALGTGIGNVQKSMYPLFADTTDATATVLTTNNSTAGSSNQVNVGSNFAVAFSGLIVAREQASGGTDCAAWEVKGLLVQANANSTVTLVNSAITVIDNTPGWTIALSADTTNGCLSITGTGAAATNIRWFATIDTADLNYS